MRITIDNWQIKAFERRLGAYRERAFPYATRETLNQLAYTAQQAARAGVRSQMTIRTPFTPRSIGYQQTRELAIDRQETRTGSIADYMGVQETGGVKSKKGARGTPIPTNYAAGHGPGVRPRKRLPRAVNRMAAIQIGRGGVNARTPNQKLVLLVRDAIESGRRVFYWNSPAGYGPREGIYRVTGGGELGARGWPKGAKLHMLYDLSRDRVSIPRNQWLEPAALEAARSLPDLWLRALRKQAAYIR